MHEFVQNIARSKNLRLKFENYGGYSNRFFFWLFFG